jgi:N-acetylglucosamine-6-phosphate deacetylase
MIRSIRNDHNKIVAVGHCQPTGAQLRAAIKAGVEYVIHLGNGHTGSSWKKFHKGGMLEECLRNDNIHVTLIADGFHLSKHYVRDWVSRKELHRVIVRSCVCVDVP